MITRRSALCSVALVLLALTATTAVVPLDVRAQSSSPRRVPDLTLVSQTPWVAAGEDLALRVRPPEGLAASALNELELAVAVHPAVTSRSAFQRTLTDRPTSSPLSVIATPMTSLTPDESGTVEVRVGVQDPAAPRDTTRIVLRNGGVYPVVAELRPPGGGIVRGRLITHLLFVPATPDGPRLGVTLVLPIARRPALQPDGTIRFPDNAATSFTALANGLSAMTKGVVLNPNPETLAALARSESDADRAAVGALRNAAVGRPVVVDEPFVPVARAAYTGAAGVQALRALVDRGREVVVSTLDSPTDARVTVLNAGIDESRLSDLGSATRLIVPERLLAPVEQRVTLANAIALRRGPARNAPTLPALVADAGLAAHFNSDRSPTLGAHQLLADLTTIYFDNPGRRRSVVIMPARSNSIRTTQMAPFLAGLGASPVLAPADLDEQFDAGQSRAAVRSLGPPGPVGPPVGLAALRSEIDSLTLTFPSDPDRVTSYQDRVLIAQSSDLRGRARSAYIRGVQASVDTEREQFRLPRKAAARLTAQTGRIPITVFSESPYPARVLLEVASDKLRFPGGSTRTLVLTRRNTTAQVSVTAQGSGTFPLRVVLKTPDGRLVLAESRFTVQSTAVSGVGVFLSIGALFVLGGWWIRHNRRYRPRQRRRAATASRASDAERQGRDA